MGSPVSDCPSAQVPAATFLTSLQRRRAGLEGTRPPPSSAQPPCHRGLLFSPSASSRALLPARPSLQPFLWAREAGLFTVLKGRVGKRLFYELEVVTLSFPGLRPASGSPFADKVCAPQTRSFGKVTGRSCIGKPFPEDLKRQAIWGSVFKKKRRTYVSQFPVAPPPPPAGVNPNEGSGPLPWGRVCLCAVLEGATGWQSGTNAAPSKAQGREGRGFTGERELPTAAPAPAPG